MYILDETSDKSLSKIIVYLTMSEILELKDSIDSLLVKPQNNHMHVPSEDYKKEITICIYDKDRLTGFNERSMKLLTSDE